MTFRINLSFLAIRARPFICTKMKILPLRTLLWPIYAKRQMYSIVILYNEVESVSAEDEAYFAGMIEDYLLSAGKSQHHTIETYYEAVKIR